MRTFVGQDGRRWSAYVDGSAVPNGAPAGIGWEAVLFQSSDGVGQRMIYRKIGWLASASDADLRDALLESESARVTWGATGR